jgi:hypothetical protein
MNYLQYHQMVTYWDTYDIAKALRLKESEVAHRISTHLHHKRSKVAA